MRVPSRTALLATSLSLVSAFAAPDEVFLRSGGRVSGVVVEKTSDAVTIETAPGRLKLSMTRVLRIVESRSAVEEFRERAGALAPGDVEGWAALARWAEDRELLTHAREAWQRVLARDPSHPEANAALGRVRLDDAWVSEAEAYRARGYVEYDGRWVTAAEHEALLRQREAEDVARRESREADLRVREAEARAREAEARAREAEGMLTPEDGGIPLWWALGSGGFVPLPPDVPFVGPPPGHGSHDHRRPGRRPPAGPVPNPPPPQPDKPERHTVGVRPPAFAPPAGAVRSPAPSDPASGRAEVGKARPD